MCTHWKGHNAKSLIGEVRQALPLALTRLCLVGRWTCWRRCQAKLLLGIRKDPTAHFGERLSCVADSGIRLAHEVFRGKASNFRGMTWSPYGRFQKFRRS
jgi:hypothetical protein